MLQIWQSGRDFREGGGHLSGKCSSAYCLLMWWPCMPLPFPQEGLYSYFVYTHTYRFNPSMLQIWQSGRDFREGGGHLSVIVH